MDSSKRSRRSPGDSRARERERERAIEAEWTEIGEPAGTAPAGAAAPPSGAPAPLEIEPRPLGPPARAVPASASLPRPLPLEILPRVGRCVTCGQPGAPRLVILGVRAFPLCSRCRLLASAASALFR